MRRLCGSLLTLTCILFAGNALAGATRRARQIPAIHAAAVGIDSQSNLWTWNPKTMVVARWKPDGTELPGLRVSDATTVVADGAYGVLVLSNNGASVEVLDWEGRPQARFVLEQPAGDAAWIDAQTVALSPKFGTVRAELRNLSGEVVRIIARAPDIVRPSVGAVLARSTLLHFDQRRRQLSTLDVITGELAIYSLQGSLITAARIPHPKAAEVQEWVRSQDREYRARNEGFAPSVWRYPTITRTADGAVWVAEDVTKTGVRTIRVDTKGRVTRREMRIPQCPSLRFTAVEGGFLFYQDIRRPGQECSAWNNEEL